MLDTINRFLSKMVFVMLLITVGLFGLFVLFFPVGAIIGILRCEGTLTPEHILVVLAGFLVMIVMYLFLLMMLYMTYVE